MGNNLEVSIRNSTDKVVIRDWYLGTANQVEQFVYSDGTIVPNTQVASLIGAMAQFGAGALMEESIVTRTTPWREGASLLALA